MCLIVALAPFAAAQTVTVAKSGTPTYATVQAAIDHFDPDPDAGTANVVQITDNAVYDEVITIDVPVKIEGTGSSRPVLAVQQNSAGDGDCGIVIEISTGTFNDVALKDLIIIPSLTSTPGDDGVKSRGQNLNILLDNCVITANDGADAPVTLDGLTEVDLSSATPFGDDGMYLGGIDTPAGDGTVVTFVNTVSSHNNNAANNDGLVCSGGNTGGYVFQDGCVFSYNNRLGIQANGSFEINAPTNRVIVKGNKGFAGLWFAGVGAGTSPVRTLDGVNVLDNGTPGVSGWGIEQQWGGSIPFTLKNAIISGNEYQGLLVGDSDTDGLITIQNVTIADNGTAAIETNSSHTGNMNLTDCIIAGNGSSSADNSIIHNGSGTIDISYSAIVLSGTSKLTGTGTSGTGTITQSSVINDDPYFTSDYDVDNPAYAGKGTSASDLGGGGNYLGNWTPPTAAKNWNLYE